MPAGAQALAKRAKERIQSQIVGALLECCFGDCVEMRLFRNQIEWYIEGRFPCGWTVDAPEEFPAGAVLKVF